MTPTIVEVHEWKEGAPRPGTAQKYRETCIAVLPLHDGALAQVGDTLLLNERPDVLKPTLFRVLEREFAWVQEPGTGHASFEGVMLHVRRA